MHQTSPHLVSPNLIWPLIFLHHFTFLVTVTSPGQVADNKHYPFRGQHDPAPAGHMGSLARAGYIDFLARSGYTDSLVMRVPGTHCTPVVAVLVIVGIGTAPEALACMLGNTAQEEGGTPHGLAAVSHALGVLVDSADTWVPGQQVRVYGGVGTRRPGHTAQRSVVARDTLATRPSLGLVGRPPSAVRGAPRPLAAGDGLGREARRSAAAADRHWHGWKLATLSRVGD